MGKTGCRAYAVIECSVMNIIYILAPSDEPQGPVKGAIALANGLASTHKVYLVFLSRSGEAQTSINEAVSCLWLSDHCSGFLSKLRYYRQLLKAQGPDEAVTSISFCLQPDMVNVACMGLCQTISSVRGNLYANYYYDYKWMGLILAFIHLFLLRFIDDIVALNGTMAQQIRRASGKISHVIGNFIDEDALASQIAVTRRVKTKESRIIFVGSLSRRKQPHLLLTAVQQMVTLGHDCHLDFVGNGPLEQSLRQYVQEHDMTDKVTFHGFVKQPAHLLVQSDIFVLPSKSEGTSRAALEALFVGVPVVLRNVDSNAELVERGHNGYVFDRDEELCAVLIQAKALSQSLKLDFSLLSDNNSQDACIDKFRQLIDHD